VPPHLQRPETPVRPSRARALGVQMIAEVYNGGVTISEVGRASRYVTWARDSEFTELEEKGAQAIMGNSKKKWDTGTATTHGSSAFNVRMQIMMR